MNSPIHFLLAGMALLAATQVANAQGTVERVTAGTLTCKSGAAKEVAEPVMRDVSCSFEPFGSGQGGTFSGDIIHKGPDTPESQASSAEILVWNVWVPKGGAGEVELLGKYYGVREDNPAEPGLGVNTLVGGADNGIMLEPVVNPGTGDGPASTRTVIEMELRPART